MSEALKFKPTMDPYSLDVFRDQKCIGMVQWHSDRDPRLVFKVTDITYDEANDMVRELGRRCGRIKVHLLHEGRTLCDLSHRHGVPKDWPADHRWVSIIEFKAGEFVNCPGCLITFRMSALATG